ncbi:4'-phosphopantetheinyl transferase superfamily protein [Sedimentitalea sp. XS_ASV28]|uniref:4'-phosphopantetheinyl transferase family protein n=1 Tax=Sedimentitalea sp. XS_ASV28 TaxID=3241296 RepID=UPI003512C5D9
MQHVTDRRPAPVGIYHARFSDLPDRPDTLSRAEMARASRFVHAASAIRFRKGRAWMRHRLGLALGMAPQDVPLITGPHDKPELSGARLHFNLSHSGDQIALAISDCPVGLDLEQPPAYDHTPLLPQIASPGELEQTDSNSPLTVERFLILWTAKEAILKLLGTGLKTDPRTIHLGALDGHDPKSVQVLGQSVCLRRLPDIDTAVAHVAVPGKSIDIRIHDEP